MALQDILRKMAADAARVQATMKPSPTQQIMSNIKQTITAPPQPSVVGRVVDQIRQVQPVQAPVKPVQYPNAQLKQQTDTESMLGTLRAKNVEASTPKPFFSPVSKPIYFPTVGVGAASDVGTPTRLNEILGTLPITKGAKEYGDFANATTKFKTTADVGNIYKKKISGEPLTQDEQQYYDTASKTGQLAVAMMSNLESLNIGPTAIKASPIIYKSKFIPPEEIRLGFDELTRGTKMGATPESLQAAQELINLNAKGSELFNAIKSGTTIRVKRDFVGWFKDLFGYKSTRTPEMNAFVAELSGKDLTKFTSKQVDNYFNKGMSLFKENRPVGLKGLEGGAARPGIEYAAPLPEKKYPLEDKGKWYGEEDYVNKGGELKNVSPDEFLKNSKPLEIDAVARENIEDLKQHIKEGRKLDPLTLYEVDKTNVKSSDGRHRAIAAKELGIKEIPVIDYSGKLETSPLPEKVDTLVQEAKQYEDKAISEHGLTTSPESAGFITLEGKLIDSSGFKQGNTTSNGGRVEGRSVDHREIAQSAFDEDLGPVDALVKYQDLTNNTRVSIAGDSLHVDTIHPITDKQMAVLARISKGKNIVADITKKNTLSASWGEFKNFNEFKKWHDDYFSKNPDLVWGKSNQQLPTTTLKTDNLAFLGGDKKLTPQELAARSEAKPKESSFEKFLNQPQGGIQQFEGSSGEVRSLEIQAQQSLKEADPDGYYLSEIDSLSKIVKSIPTNVKNKVNLLDYIRTPEKVLKKIGFGKEAELLRKGYDDYVKELPKNLDKITVWSKQVPSKSNERIFDYLDGQPITLDPKETAVANEIKAWLKDWAKKLNLPADHTITHYITHIFSDELIAKDFDEDLAKIIANKLPGQVYDPFLLKRLGARGYKRDTWAALDAYTKRATRKVNMDPALEAIKSKAGGELETSNIEESQWKYLQRYINQVNMRPTELDKLIDNSVKSIFGYKLGQRPVSLVTGLLRRMTSRGLLGLNISSAVRNLSQGANTYAVLGEKYTTIGYAKLLSPTAHQELADENILSSSFINDRLLSSTKKTMQKVDSVLYSFMSLGERINRGAAYFGAKAKYIKEHSTFLNSKFTIDDLEKKARDYAKEVVRKTQFQFGSIDQPVAMGGDIAKTLFQLQGYTTKQLEFLVEMAKDKNFAGLFRYALGGMIFVATIGKAFNMKPEELIPSIRFDTPPSLKLPWEAGKAIMNAPDKYGKERDMQQKVKDVLSALRGLVPASSQGKKTYDTLSILNEGGTSKTATGRTRFKLEEGDKLDILKAILFGPYASKGGQEYLDKLKGGSTPKGTPLFGSKSSSGLFSKSKSTLFK